MSNIRNISEGFFGNQRKPASQQALLGISARCEQLKGSLLHGERISKDDWGFIGENMDGYVCARSNFHLRNLCRDAVENYGSNVQLNWIDVSGIQDFSSVFNSYYYFDGDVSRWDTSNATNMGSMFYNCKVFNGDISGWDVSKVSNMSYMFYECEHFRGDLSSWNVSSAINMDGMFEYCEWFNCDLSSWNVSGVKKMQDTFNGCMRFSCNLASWDLSGVVNAETIYDVFGEHIPMPYNGYPRGLKM